MHGCWSALSHFRTTKPGWRTDGLVDQKRREDNKKECKPKRALAPGIWPIQAVQVGRPHWCFTAQRTSHSKKFKCIGFQLNACAWYVQASYPPFRATEKTHPHKSRQTRVVKLKASVCRMYINATALHIFKKRVQYTQSAVATPKTVDAFVQAQERARMWELFLSIYKAAHAQKHPSRQNNCQADRRRLQVVQKQP